MSGANPPSPLSAAQRAFLADRLRRGSAGASTQTIQPRGHTGPVPLSLSQERLWFLYRWDPESSLYNEPMAYRLGGDLSVPALEAALRAVVERHEVLRTRFEEADGGRGVQVVEPAGEIDFAVEETDEAGLPARLAEESARPFDLRAAPPFRARLWRVANGEHVLLICSHHIATDAWSREVLVRELSALYNGYAQGRPVALPGLPVQYADFAAWQRARVAAGALDGAMEYWVERLRGAAQLELPADRPRPAEQSFRGAFLRARVPEAVTQALGELGRAEGCTSFMVLLAAFKALLARWSGGDDVSVGTPVAGRSHEELEGLIGFFINTLVLRTDLGGSPSFRELLGRVKETAVGAYRHQEVPFERLVEALHPERDLARNPLFQVFFVLQNAVGDGAAAASGDGLRVQPLPSPEGASKFDLSLYAFPHAGGLQLSLEYATDLFEPHTAQRVLDRYIRLLELVAAEPDRPLDELELISPEEREQVVAGWNGTPSAYPRHRCLHDVISEQAARTPHAPAVESDAGGMTYAQLEEASNRMAHLLRERGVGAEDRVAILLERTPELLVTLLGVLKAGAAYVPLDPEYPAERLAYLVRDSGAAQLVTHSSLAERVEGADALLVDRLDLAPFSATRPESGVGPENLAYVIYTSGSTGKPKGAMNTHAAVMNRLLWMQEAVSLRPGEGVMQKAALGFDVAVWELLLPLMYGARVVLTRPGGQRDPEYLCERVESAGIAVLHFVPSLLPAFLDAVRANPRRVRTLRHVVCSGEALGTAVARSFTALLPGVELWNLYGPTEAAIDVAGRRVLAPADADGTGGVTPLGNPFPGCQVYALDPAGRPAPVGMWGELFLGGVQLGRGYLGRPGLTAGRWVPDPFSSEPGARLYRSGDRGRWRADGTLEFGGRVDEQVKLRGHRIEPGEIQGALLEHPAVREAAVVLRRDRGEERLAGYVVAQDGAALDVAELRAHLASRLPAYMVPAALVQLDRLPLTPNGKLDRGALPEPEYGAAREEFVPPRTHAEEVLASVWRDVLRVERVGIHDNFFHLGGDSILSLQVVSRAAAAGVRIAARQLFQHPTVAGLAAAASDAPVPGAAPAALEGAAELPLAPLQEGILFHTIYEPSSGMYFEQFLLPFAAGLRPGPFREAWERVVEANDGLRTSFVWMDRESPRQRVEEGVAPEWHEEDWDGLPPEAAGGRLDAYLAADRARGFDPVRAPLLRFALFHTGGGAYRFVISFHHLILDGWSLALVLRDVFATYGALVEGAAPRVPPRPSARPYLEWLGSQDEGAAVGFWREALAGFDAPTPVEGVPAGAPPTGPATPDDFADAVLHLPPDTSRALEGAARELRVTVNTILQGAWGLVLGSHSGESDVVFGATVAGRPPEVAGVDRMLGVFINTLPVRVRVEGERRVGEWLRDLQLRQAQARQFESTPLRTIQASSPVPAGQPLFHTLLVYENFPVEEELRDPELHGPLRFGKTRAIERPNYPLNLVVRSARQVEVKAVYDARRLDAAVVQGLLQRFARVLEQVASGEDRRLRELELLAPGERELLLSEWSGAGTPIPARRCIHEMIREQALRTPHAVAVEGETEALTYAELEERANRLAHLLRARGVGLETRVGILLERTPAIIVACIAVFKAGGAYVPLDPEYPRERLAFMLGDSGAALLLTQSSLADRVAPGCAVLRLDEEGPALAAQPATPPASGATPDHLAYVIYTSGSTGTPKGVGVPHRGGASLLVSVAGTFPASALRGVLAASSVCFDVTIFELFAALISGGSVIVAPNVLALPGLYAADRVTLLCAVPAAARELLRSGSLPRSLEVMALGGEALPADLAREVVAIPGGPALYNCYGPTEDSVYSALALVEGAPAGDPPIGRPLPGGRTYVLDAAMGPLPAGAWGELFLGGAGLARGYLGRPSLTADRFVPDPYAAEPGARLYRTGDRARWSADGVLEYGGRLDRQVKIRGFRIEPGEIEVALRDHPRVLDAAVVPHGDGDRRRLVGYVVSPDGVTPDELRAHLRDRVPAFMVPPVFVTLDAMPLNPNGKVDRGRLPSPDEAANAGGHVAPRTPVEEALAAVWCQVLGRDQVGVEDNFFEIGGDSILAIQVVARAARAGLSLSARQLFEHNTVAALASVAGVIESSSAAPDEAAEGDWAPLLPIQGWFFEQEMARPGHFNQAFALELPAGLPAGHWRALVDELVRVHPGLRLRFGRDETGAWRQRADPHAGFAWDEAELEGLDADAQRAGLREHAARLQAALDPEAGPLFGAVLGRRGAESDWLVLVAHHLGVDGVSWRVLVDDLARAHAALLQGQQSPLEVESWPLTRWARALARIAEAGTAHPVVDAAARYWQPLRARPTPPLPHDGPGGGNTEGAAGRVHAQLDAQETRALLQEVPAATRARVEEVLASALARVLGRWAGGEGVWVEMEGHGRAEELVSGAELARTVGWFTTLFPVWLPVRDEAAAALRAAKEALRAVPERGLGYGLLRARETEGEWPRPAVVFNYLGQFDAAVSGGPFQLAAVDTGPSRAAENLRSHELEVTARVVGGRLRVVWTYGPALHRAETVERLAGEYVEALREVIRDAGGAETLSPSDFPGARLGQGELDRLTRLLQGRGPARAENLRGEGP